MKFTKRTKIVFSLAATLLLVTPLFLKQEKGTFDISEVYNTQGIDASLINVKNTNVLYFKCKFKNAGILHNSLENHGISVVLGDIIFRRINGLSPAETNNKLRQLGISELRVDANGDDFEISFSLLKDNVEEALKFLTPSILHPGFTENELEYIKNLYPQLVDLETSEPGIIMQNELRQLLYKDSAYGLNQTGTAEAISKIKSSDLYDFIGKNFTKSQLEVFIVGDISRFDAAQYLSILFEKLPKGETETPTFKVEEESEKEKTLFKKDMHDVVGITLGIRLDGLSDIQKAAANVIVKTLFSDEGDFSVSLRKENIVCLQHAAIIHRRYSSMFYITCYVDQKSADNYLAFMRNRIKKYAMMQNLIRLERYQKYYGKISKTGPTTFVDIDDVIEQKSLPYDKITQQDFASAAEDMFNLKKSKIVLLKKN